MSNRRKSLLLIVALVAVLAILRVAMALLNPPPPARPPPPTPNGYTAFVQAGSLVQPNTFDYATMTLEKLQITVAGNSNALTIARAGLLEKSQAPWNSNPANMSNHLQQLTRLKELAFAFVTEGKLAEMEQRTNDAANAYLDTIHLGFESPRGGVIIDGLVGIAIEAIGTAQLQKIIGSLDEKTCADLARKIEMLDAHEEPWNQILQNESDWSRNAFPGFEQWMGELLNWKASKKALKKAEARSKTQQTKTRRLMIDLAARTYELEKGHPPGSVIDLVPDYLTAIPQDPFTGTNMTLAP
ncbi:MAG TPA: hypothetical protein VGI88_06735 [Verrucomicrobiae bacterium]